MKLSDQDPDVQHEPPVPFVPLVDVLLRLHDALDELQEGMLLMTCHYNSHGPGRVQLLSPKSAACGSEGSSNL